MTPFKLEIVTPERTFYKGMCESIVLETGSGKMGVLNGCLLYTSDAADEL